MLDFERDAKEDFDEDRKKKSCIATKIFRCVTVITFLHTMNAI